MFLKRKDKEEKAIRNLRRFFRKEGEIDISFHWKSALVVFFFVGVAVVLLCVLVFFNIGERVVFLDSGLKSEIQNINKAKLDSVIEAYHAKEEQFETAKNEGISIPSPVQPSQEVPIEIPEEEFGGEEPVDVQE